MFLMGTIPRDQLNNTTIYSISTTINVLAKTLGKVTPENSAFIRRYLLLGNKGRLPPIAYSKIEKLILSAARVHRA